MKFTIRILGRSQKHSFRSIMGFALIISMMIATAGVISGFSEQIFGLTEKAGESPSISIQARNDSVGLPFEILSRIQHTNIEKILPIAEKKVIISTTDEFLNSSVIGVNLTKFLNYYSKADIYAGSRPQFNNSYYECLMGNNLNSFINTPYINVSDNLTEFKRQFRVVGLIQRVKEFQSSIFLEIEDYTRLVNKSMNELEFHRIKISLRNGKFARKTISDLENSLYDYKSILIIKPEQQADIFTESLFFDILSKLNLLFGVLFIIALIRIFHTISWFVRKYERDILIMRAMGLSLFQTVYLVILIAFIIGNSGFFMGLFFGFLIPSALFTILSLFYYGSYYAPEFSFPIISTLFIVSNLISLIAAIYPIIFTLGRSPSTLSLSTHGLER